MVIFRAIITPFTIESVIINVEKVCKLNFRRKGWNKYEQNMVNVIEHVTIERLIILYKT